MKIIMLLSNSFDPDPRVYKEARTLTGLGHSVEVHCWDRENKHESMEIVMEDVVIKRYFYKSTYGSGFKQVIPYIKFALKVFRNLRNKSFDVIHCHDFDTLIIGALVKGYKKNIRLVYDEHDLFYQYFSDRGGIINKIFSFFIKLIERVLLKSVWKHIVVTPNMKSLYSNNNIVIIDNLPCSSSFQDITKLSKDFITVGFIGAVRHYKELKVLIDVVQSYKNDVKVQISGRGTQLEQLEEYYSKQKYNNVVFTGEFNHKELESLYKQIDITYAVYPESAFVSMPNKFFESVLTETPIIAKDCTEFGAIVQKENFGFIIDSNEDLDKQLHKIIGSLVGNKVLLEDIKKNMRNKKNKYIWEFNIPKLDQIYQE